MTSQALVETPHPRPLVMGVCARLTQCCDFWTKIHFYIAEDFELFWRDRMFAVGPELHRDRAAFGGCGGGGWLVRVGPWWGAGSA